MRNVKMCMVFISGIEKKQEIGWKIIEKNQPSTEYGYSTPYQGTKIELGETYIADKIEEKGIYIFLNKIYAKKFLEYMKLIHKGGVFLLAKVELGDRIWKGFAFDSFDSFVVRTDFKYFFSTDRIKVLDIEK